MNLDDPAVVGVLRRCRVARIATLSGSGRPSINPLYFVAPGGRIWLGTVEWTLAARNVKADPRVSLLFEEERDRSNLRVLRIKGRASVRTDRQTVLAYDLRVAHKYSLTPGAIAHALAHLRLLPLRRRYHAQAAAQGNSCVIEVIPEQLEFLNDVALIE